MAKHHKEQDVGLDLTGNHDALINHVMKKK